MFIVYIFQLFNCIAVVLNCNSFTVKYSNPALVVNFDFVIFFKVLVSVPVLSVYTYIDGGIGPFVVGVVVHGLT